MSVPLLSELREPPVVGRFYMVPVVDWMHKGLSGAWPTLGPLHHDKGVVAFPYLHFHVDPRFLTKRQAECLARNAIWHGNTVEGSVAVAPLVDPFGGRLPRLPRLARRKCRVSSWAYSPSSKPPWLDALHEQCGDPAEPRRLADGRLLCPHRKVDLSSLLPDADGIVVCPLHGLRVRCAPAQGMSARQGENSRSEVEGEARQPGPAQQDAPNPVTP